MFEFLTSDLPFVLNVDFESCQLILGVYFLLLFVGISAAYNAAANSTPRFLKIWFARFFEQRLHFAAWTLDLNFALGP